MKGQQLTQPTTGLQETTAEKIIPAKGRFQKKNFWKKKKKKKNSFKKISGPKKFWGKINIVSKFFWSNIFESEICFV